MTNETINNYIVRLKKTVEHCEYGTEGDSQIRDRILYFIRDKVLKKKLYREENLTLAKLQEIVIIFDEPDALLLTPSGTREEANTIYTKHSSGFNSPDRTFKGKCWRCDSIDHTARDCRKSKNHTYEKCGKIGHFPACCHTRQSQGGATVGGKPHRGRGGMDRNSGRGRGKQNVRSIEKRDIAVEESDTFYVFSVNPSAYVMPINIEEKSVSMIVPAGSSCNILPEATFRKMPGLKLRSCNSRVYAYTSRCPLEVMGSCAVRMSVQ